MQVVSKEHEIWTRAAKAQCIPYKGSITGEENKVSEEKGTIRRTRVKLVVKEVVDCFPANSPKKQV